MHESEAMEFIEPVLLYFLGRVYGEKEGEDEVRFNRHMNAIKDFIQDDSAFWVKEKTIMVIRKIEQAEYTIQSGEWKKPRTAKSCCRNNPVFCKRNDRAQFL